MTENLLYAIDQHIQLLESGKAGVRYCTDGVMSDVRRNPSVAAYAQTRLTDVYSKEWNRPNSSTVVLDYVLCARVCLVEAFGKAALPTQSDKDRLLNDVEAYAEISDAGLPPGKRREQAESWSSIIKTL